MQTTPHDPTNQEILEAVNSYASKMEQRMGSIEERMVTKEDVDLALGKFRSDITDYLDNKFFDFRGDLVAVIRKEDTKVKELIKVLHSKNMLTKKEANDLLQLEPFPTSV
ncbi:hypothetical protein HY621_01305 [Candidatus Uhrbacteria bacterium]|nr:hypothetical protein [Candidatus Uhrbacteria bacterium]